MKIEATPKEIAELIREMQVEDNTFDTQWAVACNEIMNDLINRTTKPDEQYINYEGVKGDMGSDKEYCTRVDNTEFEQTKDAITMRVTKDQI